MSRIATRAVKLPSQACRIHFPALSLSGGFSVLAAIGLGISPGL